MASTDTLPPIDFDNYDGEFGPIHDPVQNSRRITSKQHFLHNHAPVQNVSMASQKSAFKSFVLIVICTLAMIIQCANLTTVSISLSTIGRALRIQENQLQWLVSGYTLSSGCLLLFFGRVADLYGRKKTFLCGSIWLTAFTLGCGFANSETTLNVLRGFQGIGAAATVPSCIGILAHAFPPSSRTRPIAFASFAAGAPIGFILGVALGGVLVEITAPSWRTTFFFLACLSCLCVIGSMFSVETDEPLTGGDRRIDWLGAALVTLGSVLIVIALAQGESAPQKWRTPYIIVLLIVGFLFIGLFLLWQAYLERAIDSSSIVPGTPLSGSDTEKYLPSGFTQAPGGSLRRWTPPPLMKLSLWSRANGRLAVIMCIALLTWCCFLSWIFWVQLYYQSYLRLSPLHTVLRLLPMFVSGVICNIFVAIVISRVPLVVFLVIGTLGSTLGCLLFALINPSAPFWAYGFIAAIISVFGADFVFAAGTLYVSHVVDPDEQSLAGGLFQTMTMLGTSLGLAITTVIFDNVGGGRQSGLANYHAAQWGCFAFGLLATVLSVVFFRKVGVIGRDNH